MSTSDWVNDRDWDWTMHMCTQHTCIFFCHLQSLSPEKSTQSQRRAAGESKAAARQQRPTVFLEFGSQTKHLCIHRAQVAKTPHDDITFVCECGSLSGFTCPLQPFLRPPPPFLFLLLSHFTSVIQQQKPDRHLCIDWSCVWVCVCMSVYIRITHPPPPPQPRSA